MIRVIKPEGFGNIQLEDAPIPEINNRQVLVRTERTLISRGSELFRRYISEEALPHSIMGYSLTGTVEKVGTDVTEYQIGQRVMVAAPHAQYVVGDADSTRGHLVRSPMMFPLRRGRSSCFRQKRRRGRRRREHRREIRLLFWDRALWAA